MLWRCTEQLLEYRSQLLNSGYYARLDYVSYVSQEIGFSIDLNKSKITEVLLTTNFIANHILNICCTVADSGALGAILWGFETREIITEFSETLTSARLHVNLSFSSYVEVNLYIKTNILSILDLIFLSVVAVRISRSRLLGNFITNIENVKSSTIQGWLRWSSGLSEVYNISIGDLIIGGNKSDSLTRHIGRLLQSKKWSNSLNTL